MSNKSLSIVKGSLEKTVMYFPVITELSFPLGKAGKVIALFHKGRLTVLF